MRNALLIAAALAATAAVSGCAKQVKAPFDVGVCYVVQIPAEGAKGEVKFNRLADGQPQIEACAARLEEMRTRFLRMGGSNTDIVGAYQGQFLFIDRAGVWQSKTLDGNRFFALARTGDGRLAVPATIERAPAAATPVPAGTPTPTP